MRSIQVARRSSTSDQKRLPAPGARVAPSTRTTGVSECAVSGRKTNSLGATNGGFQTSSSAIAAATTPAPAKSVRGCGRRRRKGTRIEMRGRATALEQAVGQAPVDGDDGAGEVARLVGGEEAHDRSDLLRRAEAAQGDLLQVVVAGAVDVE